MSYHIKNCTGCSSKSSMTYNKNLTDLAESIIDSLATFELPAWGYGLRYKFGTFKQFKKQKNNTSRYHNHYNRQ
jgi:glucan phosphorylase